MPQPHLPRWPPPLELSRLSWLELELEELPLELELWLLDPPELDPPP